MKISNIKSATGKSARFLAVTMPLHILGWKSLAQGNKYFLHAVSALNAPGCPVCIKGGIQCDPDHVKQDDGASLVGWKCSNIKCDFAIFAPNDVQAVRKILDDLRARRGKKTWEDLGGDERLGLIANHKKISRLFWGLTFAAVAYFVYMMATGAQILTLVNLFVVCFILWINAIKRSYRSWQIESGVLFQEGAFKRFIMQEKWIR